MSNKIKAIEMSRNLYASKVSGIHSVSLVWMCSPLCGERAEERKTELHKELGWGKGSIASRMVGWQEQRTCLPPALAVAI